MSEDAKQQPADTVRRFMLDHLRECSKRWLGQRSQKASISACEAFIDTCIELGIAWSSAIEQKHVNVYAEGMAHRGLGASTINTRLVAVKAYIEHMSQWAATSGLHDVAERLAAISYPYVTRKKTAKWHMRDADFAVALEALDDICANNEETTLVHDYIVWTTEVGLRVEENLRLLPEDFEDMGQPGLLTGREALIVPGTKNEHSRIRIPISERAANIAQRRMSRVTPQSRRLFDISYARLHAIWDQLRKAMGVENDPTSTLKSLRRSFAATALRKGLPARIIQELMRHSKIETTMEYLRLIGLSDNDETRALLNRSVGAASTWPIPDWALLKAGMSGQQAYKGPADTVMYDSIIVTSDPTEIERLKAAGFVSINLKDIFKQGGPDGH